MHQINYGNELLKLCQILKTVIEYLKKFTGG